jgi:hypothetical protein
MKENTFKVRARLIEQLGEQLIKNESIALIELIKNAYLPFDSGFEAKSTNRDFWDGGQTPFEALKLRKYVVLCPLLFLNLVIYFSNIKYKYHNNS